MIKLTNTLTSKKEKFVPMKDKRVNMFVCGPTVYDHIHIGNARTFVIFDVVAKYLKHKGYDIKYVQNITDVDDKIIKRAYDKNMKPQKLAEKYIAAFLEDMAKLDVSAAEYAKASEYIPQIVDQVQKLIGRGYAYAVSTLKAEGGGAIEPDGNKDVYFDIQKYEKDFPGQYGKLSGQIIKNLEAEKRVEMEKNKRHPRDFVLWKAQNYSYDWTIDSPWGKGRPGWHIEDTAISEYFFSPQYDLHGGGQDLIFPHHEAEIAQQQAASGKVPFVKYWMHVGFLVNKGEKMSKSLGNFLTLRKALEKWPPEILRLFFLSNHYRSPLDFNDSSLEQTAAAIQRIRNLFVKIFIAQPEGKANPIVIKESQKLISIMEESMDDNFNTPRAFAALFDFISAINAYASIRPLTSGDRQEIKKIFDKFSEIFGIIPKVQDILPPGIQSVADRREAARKKEDWAMADRLREELKNLGYEVEDTVYGPLISKRN